MSAGDRARAAVWVLAVFGLAVLVEAIQEAGMVAGRWGVAALVVAVFVRWFVREFRDVDPGSPARAVGGAAGLDTSPATSVRLAGRRRRSLGQRVVRTAVVVLVGWLGLAGLLAGWSAVVGTLVVWVLGLVAWALATSGREVRS